MTDALSRVAWESRGSGPPLVFLHGYGAHRVHWAPWLPDLSGRHRCILVDLPGFGQAPAPADGDYSPRGLAEAVVALIRHLDLRGATLVGHSLGGGVALLVALDLLDRAAAGDPDRLVGLVSVAGAAYPQREPPFVSLSRNPALAGLGFALIPKRWLVRTAMRAIVVQKQAVTDERVEAYAEPMRHAARRRAFLRCARALVPDDLDEIVTRIPQISIPTLCLWGRQDPVVPLSVGRRLAAELPEGRIEILEECGHQVVEEKPRASLERLTAFLDEVTAQEPRASSISDAGSNPSQRTTGSDG